MKGLSIIKELFGLPKSEGSKLSKGQRFLLSHRYGHSGTRDRFIKELANEIFESISMECLKGTLGIIKEPVIIDSDITSDLSEYLKLQGVDLKIVTLKGGGIEKEYWYIIPFDNENSN